MDWTEGLFYCNVACQLLLLFGAVWCVVLPEKRIYPMTSKGPVYYFMWLMFCFVFASNFALVILDWNTGLWPSPLRLVLGLPIVALGAGFVTWGIATLGVKNTSALADGLVSSGPYTISRNPQYVGDCTLFIGIAIIANSELVLITHLLASLVFIVAPLAEESWLEEIYGNPYLEYRMCVPRFL